MKKLFLIIIISCLAITVLPQKKYTMVMRNGVLMAITDTTYIYQQLSLKMDKANFQDSLFNYDILLNSDSTFFRTFSNTKYQPKDTDLNNPDLALNLLQDSLDAKMNRSEMSNYAGASHTHTEFFDTLTISFSLGLGNSVIDTITTGTLFGGKLASNITIVEISGCTNTGTVTFNLEERGETTPNTAGTDAMSSDLVADSDQQETTTFSNASFIKDSRPTLTISAVSGDPTMFNATVKYVKTN